MKPARRKQVQQQATRLQKRITKRLERTERVRESMGWRDADELIEFVIEDQDRAVTARAMRAALLGMAEPLPEKGAIRPDSILVDDGTAEGLVVSPEGCADLFEELVRTVDISHEQIADALSDLERCDLIRRWRPPNQTPDEDELDCPHECEKHRAQVRRFPLIFVTATPASLD